MTTLSSRKPAGTFDFEQDLPSATWHIVHGLNGFPIVDAYTMASGSLQRVMPSGVTYVDANTVDVTFTTPITGYATVV